MAAVGTELTSDAMQMQAQAMLQMAAGMAGAVPPSTTVDGCGAGGVPQVDQALATQTYMQMLSYMQQGLMHQQNLAAGHSFPAGPAAAAVPPMVFPGMKSSYAAAAPSMSDPSISVSVDGMKFQYQLTEDDLHRVFNRYGSVKSIRVDDAGSSAVIAFNLFQDAQAAMNDLNGKVLNGLEGTLRIQWISGGPNLPVPPPYPTMPFSTWGYPPPMNPGSTPGMPSGMAAQPQAASGQGIVNNGGVNNDRASPGKGGGGGVRKYTCRFLIGIENDKEFQVARRIIGAKGANMKRIVKMTEAKLRLRGVGSGYFEGAGQKESSEPLQLCVSCTGPQEYRMAVGQVEELLRRVYDEYKQYCIEHGKPVQHLEVNLSESQHVSNSRKAGGAATSNQIDTDQPKKDNSRGKKIRGGKRENQGVIGELDRGEPGPNAPPINEIEKLIDDRNEARRANNFSEADRIRDLLHKCGVALMDEPGGRGRGTEVTTWRYWRD